MVTRRQMIAGISILAFVGISAAPARALTEDDAVQLVEATVQDLRDLLALPGTVDVRAPRLRSVMENRAALPRIAQFAAGLTWRSMTDAQKARYVPAFAHYVSTVYARRFEQFTGSPVIAIGRSIDAGRKGVVVETTIAQPGSEAVSVDWLISDRGGSVQVVDLVVEGVSLAATEREEIGSRLESRGGDIDALITHLEGIS